MLESSEDTASCSLPAQSQSGEAAVAAAAAADSVSVGPASVKTDARHPEPTNCAASCTQTSNTRHKLTVISCLAGITFNILV